jgi:hypothetical protein
MWRTKNRSKILSQMTSKLTYKFCVSLIAILSARSIVGCAALASTPMPTATRTATIIPTNTPTPTVKPLPTATGTPTDLELLDEKTKFLFNDPASTVIDFFLEIQDCVRTDNKEKLASLILYPLEIHSIDGKDVEIQTEEEFTANYEKIATPKWKGVILAQEPATLFTNWEGVMVNRGELWFGPICLDMPDCKQTKYYIYGIVNDTPW